MKSRAVFKKRRLKCFALMKLERKLQDFLRLQIQTAETMLNDMTYLSLPTDESGGDILIESLNRKMRLRPTRNNYTS